MSKEQVIKSGLLEQYAAGLLSAGEVNEVESYLQKWPDLHHHIVEMQDMLREVGQDYDLLDTSESQLSGRVIEMRRPASRVTRIQKTPIIWWALIGVVFLGLITSIAFFYQQNVLTTHDLAETKFRLRQLERAFESKQTSFASLQESHNYFIHPHTARVHLHSLIPKFFKGDVIAYYNPTAEQAYLKVVNIQALDEEKIYQIWADVAGDMIYMGKIETQTDGFVDIPFIPNAESLNITIEPATGSEQPTVEQLVMSGEIEL